MAHTDSTGEILPPQRDERGRWLRGTPTPYTGGARPKAAAEVRELAREASPAAIRRLIAIVNDDAAPYAAQIAASIHLLDRAWGKPVQSMEINDRPRTLEDMLCDLAELRARSDADTSEKHAKADGEVRNGSALPNSSKI